MSEARKTKSIAFRLTDEEYDQVERCALAAGEDVNTWCRRVVLMQSSEGYGLTKNDRLMYEEIAPVRYLVGNGFRILFGSEEEATAATWRKVTAQADQRAGPIADGLLSRRQ